MKVIWNCNDFREDCKKFRKLISNWLNNDFRRMHYMYEDLRRIDLAKVEINVHNWFNHRNSICHYYLDGEKVDYNDYDYLNDEDFDKIEVEKVDDFANCYECVIYVGNVCFDLIFDNKFENIISCNR